MAPTIIWLVSSIIGLAVAIYGTLEAVKDRKALDAAGITNGRRLVANQRVFAQASRCIIFSIATAVGVYALTENVSGTAVVYGLVVINGLYTVIASTDVYVGWRLRQ